MNIALGPVLNFIRADASAGRLDAWGVSTVFDEHARVLSFERELFEQMHEAAGIEATFPVGNAGVIHVYGYWFSTVRTAFGYKRDRWHGPELPRAFGLEPDVFHLNADSATTPLERVTDVALPLLLEPPKGAIVVDAPLEARRSRVVLVQPPGVTVPALIYGISPVGAALKLITTFPLQGDPTTLLQEFELEPKPRWNAVIDS